MGGILDKLDEWLRGLLIEGITGNLSGMFDTVNTKVGEIAGEVGQTPLAWNSGVFSMIRNLSETVIVPIAGVILTFVMCYELIQLVTEKNNLHDVDTWMFFKWIFKTFCAVLIVTNTWNIVMGIFDVGQSVVNSSAGVIIGNTSIDISSVITDMEAQLEALGTGELFGLWFQSLFVGLTMASIIKRKKNYSVVYNYMDENGETKQKWETWHTHKEALKRKAEIENQQHTGTFLPPSNQTITEFLYDFVSLYGEKKWGVSMYDSQTALIANYINPIIGNMEVQAVTPRAVDGYIQTLQKTKSVSTKTRKAVTTYVSDKTIEKIIKLLRCAFKQAVRWEIIARNPFDNVILPKTEYAKRDIWTADMIRLALDKCTDSKLYVAMNLSFACSLRMGEILGLTWENVHISDEDIAADNAYVYIDKELTRASKRAIETLGEKDIYYIFTPLMPNTSTRIILKKPKTDSSIRKVWLPKTLAYILQEWKKSQDELKGFLGDEYQDFDLVVALPNGRPCEDRIILKEFAKLREDAGLPKVVFHSLRHSSTTYKLKLNHGDLKATQGDTGHAEIDMITSIYAHILDEDRKVNAQKFETAFYAKPDLRNVRPPEEPVKSEPATLDLESLVEQLQKSPELASALAALIAAQAPAK